MATLVLDFDSCLVPVESLELYAERELAEDSTRLASLIALTDAGMDGRISFEESLQRRLDLLTPERELLTRLGEELAMQTSQGSTRMVKRLQHEGHEVWIVSGGFLEVLLPVSRALGIPEARVHGLRARFDARGRYLELDETRPFHRSKVAGLTRVGVGWPRPAVGVGDGMTDLALQEAGFVDAFIAYTEHVQRQAVLARSRYKAQDMVEVESIVRRLWMEMEENR